MNIDWSKAPEDATHVGTKQVPGVTCWYKLKEGVFYFWYCTNDDLDFDGWAESKGDPIHTPLIERPKKQEAWNGEGLPPVGTVCDMHIDDFGWITGTVVVHIDLDEPAAVAHNGEEVFHGNASDFRPIKTADQVAAEEREKAISDMMEVTSDGISCIGQDDALALYKAGYRKQ